MKIKMNRHNAINSVMAEIARSEPFRAKKMLTGLKDAHARQAAISAYVNSASSTDPEGVFALLNDKSGQASSFKPHLFHGLFQTWARENPETAMARLGELKGSQARQVALGAMASALAATDPGSAIAFANGLENARERSQMMGGIAGILMMTDPQRALALLDGMPAGQTRTGVISSISGTWLQNDPDAAMAWIDTLPRKEQAQAVSQGIDRLVYFDPGKAAELLMRTPPNSFLGHYFTALSPLGLPDADIVLPLIWASCRVGCALPFGLRKRDDLWRVQFCQVA